MKKPRDPSPPPSTQIELHNNLVRHTMETMTRLSVIDQRVVGYLVSVGIQNPKDEEMPRRVKGSVADLARICGISGGDIYRSVRKATESLMTQLIRFRRPSDGASVSTTWLAEGVYYEKEGVFEVQFSDSMRGLLTALSKHRTVLQLETMLGMGSSQYAIRLYQIAKSFESLGTWKTPIEHLKQQMGVPQQAYKRLSDFRKMVLDYPINIINERSDISLVYAKGNMGRAWKDIIFHITKAKPKTCEAPKVGFASLDAAGQAALWRWVCERYPRADRDPEIVGWIGVPPTLRDDLWQEWRASLQPNLGL